MIVPFGASFLKVVNTHIGNLTKEAVEKFSIYGS